MALPPISNKGYKLGHWYIDPKYANFKKELLSNIICRLPSSSWNILRGKARILIKTYMVRQMKCPRKDSAKYFDMEYNQSISVDHLVAMMIYCNFDELQRKFTETFRHTSKNESINELKERHQNYCHLGRLLREIVECFGMDFRGFFSVKQKVKNINLYHGVNDEFTFSSLNAFIAGPLSTTTDYYVAMRFCSQNDEGLGMILNLDMHRHNWMMKINEGDEAMFKLSCIDCRIVSDYVSEQEVFCIGGLCRFTFNTIIKASTGNNYCRYIKGLKQMTYFMGNGDIFVDQINNVASSLQEQQMVFRLLSHELHRYYPNH
eukprot:116860_1